MDLRLDIERRKKNCTHERPYNNQDREKDVGVSQDSSRERSVEKHKYVHIYCTLFQMIYKYDEC